MKKHPIDDVFRNKLADLERKPSAAAWDRLSREKTGERRLTAWVWYAAAGVVVVFMAGYLVWMNQSAETKPQLAGVEVQKPAIIKDSVVPQIKEQPVPELSEIPKESFAVESKEPVSVNTRSQIAQNKSVPDDQSVEIAVVREPVVVEQKVEIASPTINPIKQVEASQVAVAVNSAETNVNRTIVVKVEEHSVLNEEKEKPSRFTRIFRQLKNVKQGESVDWDDVGFNPKALVARVDDGIRNSEEKVSEKYQNIKERTKL